VLGLAQKISEARQFIYDRWPTQPQVGMILGTGLGDLAEQISMVTTIAYEEIPHFLSSTVQSHAGQLVCGRLKGVPVLAMEGRFHYYEGYSMQQITFPVRVMKALGAEILLITNAAGGMNPEYQLADIIILDDQINLMGDNPLRGINNDNLGPRFPDMLEPYDQNLIDIATESAQKLAIDCHTGILVAVSGPNLETRAEYRMLRRLGADVVGMSTIPEVLVAKHAGLRVLAFSIVTDMCLPNELQPVEIEKILEVAGRGSGTLARLISRIFEQLGES